MRCPICGSRLVRHMSALRCPNCLRHLHKLVNTLINVWAREDALRAENAVLRERCAALERQLKTGKEGLV